MAFQLELVRFHSWFYFSYFSVSCFFFCFSLSSCCIREINLRERKRNREMLRIAKAGIPFFSVILIWKQVKNSFVSQTSSHSSTTSIPFCKRERSFSFSRLLPFFSFTGLKYVETLYCISLPSARRNSKRVKRYHGLDSVTSTWLFAINCVSHVRNDELSALVEPWESTRKDCRLSISDEKLKYAW